MRQERHSDGNLGLGSGWLTEYLPLNGTLSLRLRRNSGFHLPETAAPMILIGNGTGLAGLRSLIRARVNAGEQRNWLLFGERNRAHDLLCGDELQGWLQSGDLARLDLAFSRDQAEKCMCRMCCCSKPRNSSAGWRMAPVCMSAAACKGWLRGWMRRSTACLVKPLCSS